MKHDYAEIIESLDETEILDLDFEHINSIETTLDYETKRKNAIGVGVIFAFGSFLTSAVFGPIGIIFSIISLIYVLMVKKRYHDKSILHIVVTCLGFVAAIVNIVCLFGYVNYQNDLYEKRLTKVDGNQLVEDFDASNQIDIGNNLKDPKTRLREHLLELKYSTTNGTYYVYDFSINDNKMYRSFNLELASFLVHISSDDLNIEFDYSYVSGTVAYTYTRNGESSYIVYWPDKGTYTCSSAVTDFCEKEAVNFVEGQIKDNLKKFDEILEGSNVKLEDLKK